MEDSPVPFLDPIDTEIAYRHRRPAVPLTPSQGLPIGGPPAKLDRDIDSLSEPTMGNLGDLVAKVTRCKAIRQE